MIWAALQSISRGKRRFFDYKLIYDFVVQATVRGESFGWRGDGGALSVSSERKRAALRGLQAAAMNARLSGHYA